MPIIFAAQIIEPMEESENEYNYNEKGESVWETYIGKGGSSVVVFLLLAFLFTCIFLFIRIG